MQSFKTNVSKKYRLLRGYLVHITHISFEQLKPRLNSFIGQVEGSYKPLPYFVHPEADTRIVLNPEVKEIPGMTLGDYNKRYPHEEKFVDIEAFCSCGNHDSFNAVMPLHTKRHLLKSLSFKCTSCGEQYPEGMNFFVPAPDYREEGYDSYSISSTMHDATTLFDDMLEKNKISLKFLGHQTFFNPKKGRLNSNDVARKLIYSKKMNRLYLYNGRGIKDITYNIAYHTEESIMMKIALSDEHMYEDIRAEGKEIDEHTIREYRERHNYDGTESMKRRFHFGEFFRRVYDAMDLPAWAPDFDETRPTESIQRSFMSMVSPNSNLLFERYFQSHAPNYGKELRRFDSYSEAMDAMLNQPSGVFRKLIREAQNDVEFAHLLNVALGLAGVFKEYNHLNTLLRFTSETYREFSKEGRRYFYNKARTMENLRRHVSFNPDTPLDELFSIPPKPIDVITNRGDVLTARNTLFQYEDHDHVHSGSIPWKPTLVLKKNKSIFNMSENAQDWVRFKNLFKVSEKQLVDILKFQIERRIKEHNSLLVESSLANDMSRLLNLIQGVEPSFLPKLEVDIWKSERRLINLYNRVGSKEFMFNYSEERLKLEGDFLGFRFRLPKQSSELNNLGNRLSHCVGGYQNIVLNGVTTIVIVERDDKYILAVQVTNGKVVQAKGMSNNLGYHVPQDVIDAVLAWSKHHKLTIKTSDLTASGGRPLPYVESRYEAGELEKFDLETMMSIYKGRVEEYEQKKFYTFDELKELMLEDSSHSREFYLENNRYYPRALQVAEPEPFNNHQQVFLGEDDLPF